MSHLVVFALGLFGAGLWCSAPTVVGVGALSVAFAALTVRLYFWHANAELTRLGRQLADVHKVAARVRTDKGWLKAVGDKQTALINRLELLERFIQHLEAAPSGATYAAAVREYVENECDLVAETE